MARSTPSSPSIHIPGTNICTWPSYLRAPLEQLYPGIAAACAAGAVIHNNPNDLKKYTNEVIGGGESTPPTFGGIAAVGDLAGRLTETNTWVRVGEFVVGGILLYIALRSMFPTQVGAVASVAKIARAA